MARAAAAPRGTRPDRAPALALVALAALAALLLCVAQVAHAQPRGLPGFKLLGLDKVNRSHGFTFRTLEKDRPRPRRNVTASPWHGITPNRRLQQPIITTPVQFDMDGCMSNPQLSQGCANQLCGGSFQLDGLTIKVPDNAVVYYPANTLAWAEAFPPGWSPAGGNGCNEVHVVGNMINGELIAGLIEMAELALGGGSGFVQRINADGSFVVGSVLGAATQRSITVRINDPNGVYGLATAAGDAHFQVDIENPTVMAATGYPMCVPRVMSPSIDPYCPLTNRPTSVPNNQPPRFVDGSINPTPNYFTMNCPRALSTQPPYGVGFTVDPFNPYLPAPILVNDFVTFAGYWTGNTLYAFSVGVDAAIFTCPGTEPVYNGFEVAIAGVGGANLPTGEATARSRFEGFTTDPTRSIHVWGVDFAYDGTESFRDYGYVGVDLGANPAFFVLNGALGTQAGRWRLRPPCNAAPPAAGAALADKTCSPPPNGAYTPPTREVMATVHGIAWDPATDPTTNPTLGDHFKRDRCTGAGTTDDPIKCVKPEISSIHVGHYRNPTIEYLFAENRPGFAQVENNFAGLQFLRGGGYYSTADGSVPGTLSPWPDSATFAAATCGTLALTITDADDVSYAASSTTAPLAPNTVMTFTGSTSGLTGVASYTWSVPAPPPAPAVPTCFLSTTSGPEVDFWLSSGTCTLTATVTGCGTSKTIVLTIAAKSNNANAKTITWGPTAPQQGANVMVTSAAGATYTTAKFLAVSSDGTDITYSCTPLDTTVVSSCTPVPDAATTTPTTATNGTLVVLQLVAPARSASGVTTVTVKAALKSDASVFATSDLAATVTPMAFVSTAVTVTGSGQSADTIPFNVLTTPAGVKCTQTAVANPAFVTIAKVSESDTATQHSVAMTTRNQLFGPGNAATFGLQCTAGVAAPAGPGQQTAVALGPTSISVTVTQPPFIDSLTAATAQFRTKAGRLDIAVTWVPSDNLAPSLVTLQLESYTTDTNGTAAGSTAFTIGAGGAATLTLTGVYSPFCTGNSATTLNVVNGAFQNDCTLASSVRPLKLTSWYRQVANGPLVLRGSTVFFGVTRYRT